jgi:hypothetical protein
MWWSKRSRTPRQEKQGKPIPGPNAYISEEIIAAIGLALTRYEEDLRSAEHMALTINRVARAYSPWSSKIYGIMNQPVGVPRGK